MKRNLFCSSCTAKGGLTEETRYYLRHQVSHLEAANRTNDIHRLLAARTPEKQNAWYKAKQTIGDTNGYLDDINRAWRICEHDSLQGGDKNQIATNIGLQIRYALIRSSIVGLIASMPPSWLWALVDKGVWSPSEAVRYTARMPRSETKAIALSRLAPALPLPELREALDVAKHIRDIRHKEAALAGLAPRLAELGNTQEALDIVTKINWQENRRDALIGICPYLPSSLLTRFRQIARRLEYSADRLLALSALAKKIPLDARAEVCCEALDAASKAKDLLARTLLVDGLVALSHSLPWDMIPKLIKAVNSLLFYDQQGAYGSYWLNQFYWSNQEEKGPLLVSLVRRMAQLGKTAEAIQLTSQIEYQQWRSEAIASLAVNLTPSAFPEVVELAHKLQFAGDRARALTALAASVCCPTCRKQKLLEEALKAINQIDQNDEIKAYCILDIIPYLPQTLLSVVVHNARRINSEVWRKATFIALASILPESDRDEALQNLPEDAVKHFSEFLIGGYCGFISAWRLPILSVHYLPDFHVWRAIKDCNKIFEYVKNHLRSQVLQKTLLVLQSGRVQAPWGETDLRPFQVWGAREMLAPYLSRDLLEQALKTLSISEDDDWQAATIAAYFPHLPKPLKLEMMLRSVTAVQAHDYELSYNQVRGHMAELAPLLPPTFVRNVDGGHSKYGWNFSWNDVPGWIVKRMAVNGFFKEALTAIKKMNPQMLQAKTMVEAMEHLPISLFPQTLALVRDQNCVGRLLSQIIDAAEPLFEEAIISAYKFEDAGKRGELLAAIALRLAQLGQAWRALETVKTIDYEWFRSEALVNIVEYLPSSMMKRALHMALSLHFDYDRLRALTSIACHANGIIQKDALDEAIKMICETRFESFKWVIPGSLIKLCDYLNEDHIYHILASFTHTGCTFGFKSAEAIGCLVYRLAELSYEDEALEIACGFSMQIYKREAFSRLGTRSERFLLKGIEVAKKFEAIYGSWTDKWILIVNLAPHMSETNIDKALHLLKETRDGGQTFVTDLSALSALLLRLTELGYVERALEIMESYLTPEFRGKALITLANRLTQPFVPTALRIARTVPITPDRINALAAISIQAEEPFRRTALEEALDTATTIAYGLFDSQAFWAYGTGAPWADSLRKLLPLLSEDLLQKAWSMLKDIELLNYEIHGIEGRAPERQIPSSINILLPALAQRPLSISFPYLSEILQVASNRLRSDMLRHIPAMVDFIIHVGGEKAAEEVVRAVQEVCSQKWLS